MIEHNPYPAGTWAADLWEIEHEVRELRKLLVRTLYSRLLALIAVIAAWRFQRACRR